MPFQIRFFSSAEGAEACVARFTSLVRIRIFGENKGLSPHITGPGE